MPLESHRVKWRGLALLLVLCLLPLSGCGAGNDQHELEIDGDESFAGMPNPGSLSEAIALFGYPNQMYGGPGDSIDCYVRWKPYGIKALFQNWGAVGGGQTCAPRRDFVLTSVELRGAWHTDRGLKVGDSIEQLTSIYGIGGGARCADEVGGEGTDAWTMRSVKDPLGGPGSRLCTLGVIVARGKVVGFLMSNQNASE